MKSVFIIISWRNSLKSETHKSSRGDDSHVFLVVLKASEHNKDVKVGRLLKCFFSVLPPECCSLTTQVTSKNPEDRRVKASLFLQLFLRAALQGRHLHLLASSSTKHQSPEVCSTYKYPRLRWDKM